MTLCYGVLPSHSDFCKAYAANFSAVSFKDKVRSLKEKEYTCQELWEEVLLAMKEHEEQHYMFSRIWVNGVLERLGINWDWTLVQKKV